MSLRRPAGISLLASLLAAGSASIASADFVSPPPALDSSPAPATVRFAAHARATPQFTVDATGISLDDSARLKLVRDAGDPAARRPAALTSTHAPSIAEAVILANSAGASSAIADVFWPPPGAGGGPPAPRGGGREPGPLGGFGHLTPITIVPGFGQPSSPVLPIQPLPAPGSALLGVLGIAAAAVARRRA